MKPNFFYRTISVIFILCCFLQTEAQVTVQGNNDVNANTDYVGWDNTTAYPLNIKQNETSSPQNIQFWTNGTQKMTLLGSSGSTDGYLGLNITTPHQLLQLHDGITQWTNSTTGSGSGHGLLIGENSNNGEIYELESHFLNFKVGPNTIIMNLNYNGNLGIGTGSTAAANRLEVLAPSLYQLRLTYDGSHYSDIGTSSTGNLVLTPIIPGPGQGAVCIGVTSPTGGALDVESSTIASTVYVANSYSSGGKGMEVHATGSNSYGLTAIGKTYGMHTEVDGTSGTEYGLQSLANAASSTNYGVESFAGGASTANYGVKGTAQNGTNGSLNFGVYGYASNTNGNTGNYYGVFGKSNNTGNGSGAIWAGYFEGNVKIVGDFTVDGTCYNNDAAWHMSDEALKTNIVSLSNDDALLTISQLNPSSYYFDTNQYPSLNLPSEKHYGFLAQELQNVLPDLVRDVPNSDPVSSAAGLTSIKRVNYEELIPILTAAVKDLSAQNSDLQNQLSTLQDQVNGCCGLSPMQRSENNNSGSNQTIELNNSQSPSLGNAVPNPHRDQCNIPYFIPATSSEAQIIFTDELGREVNTVDIVTKGQGQLTILTSQLQDGVYTYSLVVDGKVIDTKKMLKAAH